METCNKKISSYRDLQMLFDEIHKSNNAEESDLHKMLYAVRYLMKRLASGDLNAYDFMLKWCHAYLEMHKKVVNYIDEFQNAITVAVSYIIGCLQFNNKYSNNYHITLLQAAQQLLENATLKTLQDIGNLSTCTLMCLWKAIDHASDFNTQFMIIKLMSIILKFCTNEENKSAILQEISTSGMVDSMEIFSQIIGQASHCGIFQNAIRDLLNKYNTKSTKVKVLSLHCKTLTFGNNYSFHKPLNTNEFWLDFNYDYYTLTFEGRFKSNMNETCETVKVSVKVEHVKLQSNTLIVDFRTPITFSKMLNELEELNKETKILLKLSEEEVQRLNANYSCLQRFNTKALKQRRSSGLSCILNQHNNNRDDHDNTIHHIENTHHHNYDNNNCVTKIQYCKNDNKTKKKMNRRGLSKITLKDSEEENRNSPINLNYNNENENKNSNSNVSPTSTPSDIDLSQNDTNIQDRKNCLKPTNIYKSLNVSNKKRNHKKKLNNSYENDHNNNTSDDSHHNVPCSSQNKIQIQNDSKNSSRPMKNEFFQVLELSDNTELTGKRKRVGRPKKTQRKSRTAAKKPKGEESELNPIVIDESNNNNVQGNNANENFDELIKQNARVLNSPTLLSTILDNFPTSAQENMTSARQLTISNNNNNNNNVANCSNNESIPLSLNSNLMNLTNMELIRDCGEANTSIFSSSLIIDDRQQVVPNNTESLLGSTCNWNDIVEYNENVTTEMDCNGNGQLMTPNMEVMQHIECLVQQNLEENIFSSTPVHVAYTNNSHNSSSNEEDILGNITAMIDNATCFEWRPTSQIPFYIKHIHDITQRVLNHYQYQYTEMNELKQNIGQHINHLEWLYNIYKKRTENFERFRQNIEYILRLLDVNLKLLTADNNDQNTS